MANSIDIWIGLVRACIEKWQPEKYRLAEKWHVFDLPLCADEQGGTVSAKRWEPWMMSSEAGMPLPPDVAAKWAADWNAVLDEWDCFHASARAAFQALWKRPEAVAAGKRALRKKRALHAEILDLLSRPSEPEPSAAHHEIWDRLARRREEDRLQGR